MSSKKIDDSVATRRKALQACPREITVHKPHKYWYNEMAGVNPSATFDAFEIYDDEQRKVVDRLRRVAEQLVARKNSILTDVHPFDVGKILFLTSPPGHGKTHLAHAIINHVADNAPEMLSKIVVAGHKFGYDHQVAACEYGGASIVLIDDIFSDLQSVQEVHPATDVQAFMRFIGMLYERRIFAIITSNFRMMNKADGGLLERVRLVDKIGRTLSRCEEVMGGSGEIVLSGKDFRSELAVRRKATVSDDEFSL